MGSAYTSLVETMPLVTSAAWEPWLHRLVAARVAAAPAARTTTYYFDPTGGSDPANGLTTGTPKQTLGAAQTLINASSGDIRIRIKGGTHTVDPASHTTAALSTGGKDGVTIDTYTTTGLQGKAVLNFFSLKYNSAGWTVASGDRYTRAETNTVAWVRSQSNRLGIVYQRVSSTALVESTPLSWFWAANVLHVNSGSGVNPNTLNLEAVKANDIYGVLIAANSDGCRVENIRVDGAGINPASPASNIVGVSTTLLGTDAGLVIGCESYYCGSHAMVQNATGTGGISTWMYCRAGYTMYNAGTETVFNSHSSGGGQETIWYACDADYGTLPSSDWYNASTATRRAGSCYSHTGGGAAKQSLVIAYNCRVKANTYGCNSGMAAGDLPDATSSTVGEISSAVRCVIWGEVIEPANHVLGGALWVSNAVRINAEWKLKPPALPGGAISNNAFTTGWLINSYVEVDWSNVSGDQGMYNGTSASDPKTYYCTFRHVIPPTQSGLQLSAFDTDNMYNTTASGNSDDAELINSVVALDGGAIPCWVGLNNDPDKMKNNAFYGFTDSAGVRGHTLSENYTLLPGSIGLGWTPFEGSPLYRTGSTSVVMEFDINGFPVNRAAPCIGPFGESLPRLNRSQFVEITK